MRALGLRRSLILTALLFFFSPLLAENAFAALISANPTQGPPGSAVTVTGSQWPPGDKIKLSWNFSPFNTVASVQADGNGNFTAVITVPPEAPIGLTRVNAINEAGKVTWQAEFTVTAGELDATQMRIDELEQWLQQHPGVFDWRVHNELRHLYCCTKNPPDLRKAMEHSDIILEHSPMDDYILHILSGWQIDKDIPAAIANLLNTAQSYPDLRFLVAACFLKIGDLYIAEDNPEEAKSYYLKVAEDNSPDMAQYRSLAEERMPVAQFKFPWDEAISLRFTEGPHAWLKKDDPRSGLDFASGDSLTHVLAMADGQVTYVGEEDCAGKCKTVKVSHDTGLETWYVHLSSFAPDILNACQPSPSGECASNVQVLQGTWLGNEGGTGAKGVIHVHIELRENGQPISWDNRTIDGWTIHQNCNGYNKDYNTTQPEGNRSDPSPLWVR